MFDASGRVVRGKTAVELYNRITDWMKQVNLDWLGKNKMQWHYSKSRGPGGQSVNKSCSKAELCLNVKDATWIPPELKVKFEKPLIIKSDLYKSQEDNKRECLLKLRSLLLETALKVAPRPTLEEQMEKVDQLSKMAKLNRLYEKKERSNKKSDRKIPKFTDFP